MTATTTVPIHRHPTVLIAGLAVLAIVLVAAVLSFVDTGGDVTTARRPAATAPAPDSPNATYSGDLGRSLGATTVPPSTLDYGSADAAERSAPAAPSAIDYGSADTADRWLAG